MKPQEWELIYSESAYLLLTWVPSPGRVLHEELDPVNWDGDDDDNEVMIDLRTVRKHIYIQNNAKVCFIYTNKGLSFKT